MMEQRSSDWFAIRCGRLTASRVADMMARTKTGWGASRANYRAQLVCERLTGTVEQSFCNAAMQFGVDNEDAARAAYQIHALCSVEEIGFVEHPSLEMAGASPDGLIGDSGLIEIKVPNTSTHIETLLAGCVPDKYFKQMQFQLACTGRAWCDYVSFDPRMPEPMRLWVKRVERDDAAIKEIEECAAEFLGEVDQIVARLQEQYSVQLEAA